MKNENQFKRLDDTDSFDTLPTWPNKYVLRCGFEKDSLIPELVSPHLLSAFSSPIFTVKKCRVGEYGFTIINASSKLVSKESFAI